MTETKTPETTPSPTAAPLANSSQVTVGKPENPKSVFVGMALDMSWRLALVVLLPIIGGFELDSRLGTTPLITVVGFLIAMVGFGLVLWRTTQAASQMPETKTASVVPTEAKQEKQS
jgi:F0F1-type ATP synthase assembly protein I